MFSDIRPRHRLCRINAPGDRSCPTHNDSGSSSENGYVTAETALALPSLLIVFCSLLLIVVAAGDRIRCADAAWEAARLTARGEPAEQVEEQVRGWAPAGADISLVPERDAIRATVSVRLGLPGARLPAIRVSSTALVACEAGLSCTPGDP